MRNPADMSLKTEQPEPRGFRISGRVLILIIVVATIAGIALTAASFYLNAAPTKTTSMLGTLTVNSGGRLSAPASYAATYNVSLNSYEGNGTLNFTLISKGSDALTMHNFTVTNVVANAYNLNMTVSGQAVELSWINNSTIWKGNNESYFASWGPAAPTDELVGTISPADFPGLQPAYYVVLILTVPAQPADTIPFEIGTGPA
jgi:hypothetical protein